jgi:hypothetical protein
MVQHVMVVVELGLERVEEALGDGVVEPDAIGLGGSELRFNRSGAACSSLRLVDV